MKTKDRLPSVAGKFYPQEPDILEQQVTELLSLAKQKQAKHVKAIVVPHAGYIYSGSVAASAYNQIDKEARYKRVFLIGSSHHSAFTKASLYCDGDFMMPYGIEKVDIIFCKQLAKEHPDVFSDNGNPHLHEHSLEVQLPFLHHVLKNDYHIVPILIGSQEPSMCARIAAILKSYLTSENLFVISTDFSHYPAYDDAREVDAITKDAILKNNPKSLMDTLTDNYAKHIPHLATSLCGWTSVLTLLNMTSGNEWLKYYAMDYCNSGDAEFYSDRKQVVGYWAIVVSDHKEDHSDIHFSMKEKAMLLDIARKALEESCRCEKIKEPVKQELPSALSTHCGVFVSLHKDGHLRGCIGRLTGNMPLYKMTREMAINAAFHDSRFTPVRAEELDDIDIEISVLSPLRRIFDMSEIELGKHGIYIENGYRSGVFLPQVAIETGWDVEQFLGHCARDKAGLSWEGWKNANLHVFTATVFDQAIIDSVPNTCN